ncbi:hypothetical protein [Nocardia beijingensis]|uniref:Chalcone/stilbene synthase N-terminal domain-containing protein n=1 Tax=Nocardia beijingensis TaxID=95162 RepID=A0ABW7WEJ9_9NOCA
MFFRKTMIGSRRFAVDPRDPRIHAPGGEPATIQERMRLFYRHAVPVAVDVARRALDGTDPAHLGLLIFATSTGVIAPGVDVAVVETSDCLGRSLAWSSTSWAARRPGPSRSRRAWRSPSRQESRSRDCASTSCGDDHAVSPPVGGILCCAVT